MVTEHFQPPPKTVRHWGAWNNGSGWYYVNGVVFYTKHLAIARAQCDMVNRILPEEPDKFRPKEYWYYIRCIEDWHAEEIAALEER